MRQSIQQRLPTYVICGQCSEAASETVVMVRFSFALPRSVSCSEPLPTWLSKLSLVLDMPKASSNGSTELSSHLRVGYTIRFFASLRAPNALHEAVAKQPRKQELLPIITTEAPIDDHDLHEDLRLRTRTI